ncbi:MAG: hypothetical protein JO308_02120 [Verrucomicrobia bacterium]|nr:hypothetical protein [Verrucomicrobiota bacterium]
MAFSRDLQLVESHVREGRFQRSLALVAGLSSILAGAEVAYEHYRGSYGQKIMYTPVILSVAMACSGVWGAFNRRVARTLLRWVSAITLADGLVGFCFHIRGIARKPGGWRLPITNIIMGPPIFAPLLFGVSAYLGGLASFLRPEEIPADTAVRSWRPGRLDVGKKLSLASEIRQGRYQKHLALVTILGTLFSGSEALYSHYKNNFQYRSQWTPVILSPLLIGSAAAAIPSQRAAQTALPLFSILAMVDGAVGFAFHVRGVWRRPGGKKKLFYNIIYGPPIFAPLLFAACGFVGLLASMMRRENP